MFVSFSLQNYRSFASKQTISLVAGTEAMKNQEFSFPSKNSWVPNLLRSSCVFGPNASGKSSLVMAIESFRQFIVSSAKNTQEGEQINITCFKLDEKWITQPTEFEIVFVYKGYLYQYGYSVNQERVWDEWLFCKSNKTRSQTKILFRREYNSETDVYIWYINKTNIKGEKEQWKKATRNNSLFLSTAIQLNADSFKEPFEWIQHHLKVISSIGQLSNGFTADHCIEGRMKNDIINFLRVADIKIEDIGVEEKNSDEKLIDLDINPNGLNKKYREHFNKYLKTFKAFNVKVYHQGKSGQLISFSLQEESDGSQIAFKLAGPWLNVLENGYTLIIDELHNSLHPHVVKFLVNLFHDPKVNKNNAQLIFTTHETSIMHEDSMHQDQVWFTQKNHDAQSVLTPLSDYKITEDPSDFQKAYLNGRYGAIPKIRELIHDK